MSRLQFEMRLRDQEVSIDLEVLPPDPDVGVRGYWFEDLCLYSFDGEDLEWVLTQKELEAIGDELSKQMENP